MAIHRLLQKEQPTILHCNSSVAGLAGVIAGRVCRIPKVIYTTHGWAFNEDRPWVVRLILKVMHWLTVLLAHETIAVSSGVAQQLDWPGARSMRVIPLGRATDDAHYLPPTEARQWFSGHVPNLGPHTFLLVMIAELHPVKQHTRLFQAIAKLPKGYDLQVACIGDGALRAQLEKDLVHRQLQDKVTLLGEVIGASRYLPGADALVLPSRSESFGYVLLEAGGASVPVIASNVGGIPDIIKDRENGLLVSQTGVGDLADAIKTLQEDHALRAKLGAQLHQTAHKFTVAKMVEDTVKIY
jgi:glycosyltransferase involved in cell wall biosynthesis